MIGSPPAVEVEEEPVPGGHEVEQRGDDADLTDDRGH
jgi:hypothetical protein